MNHKASGLRSTVSPRDPSALERWFCLGMLAVALLLYIALNAWDIASIPVRGIVLGGFLILLVLLYPDAAKRAVTRHSVIFVLAAAMAGIGIFVSIANSAGLELILRSVLEVHVQILLSLVFATIVAEVAGARASALVIVGAVGLSTLVAILQFVDFDFAWDLRAALGTLQGHAMHEDSSFLNRRPMGLSFSPIQLTTQLCLAFAIYVAVVDKERISRPGQSSAASSNVVAAAFLLIAFSIAAATRSPILGACIFLIVYLVQRQSGWLLVLLLAGGALTYFAGEQLLELFQSKQARVLRIDDDSAMGRLALWKFGMLLFRDNPLGYGFGFVPASQHWMPYWHELYTLQGADDIKTKELHNYVLIMLNTYGVGLMLILPLLASILRRVGNYLIYFIPYLAHIMFHNSGPFWNDTLIWFVVGALSAGVVAAPSREGQFRAQAIASVWRRPLVMRVRLGARGNPMFD
jgi:O-Antigen ligase